MSSCFWISASRDAVDPGASLIAITGRLGLEHGSAVDVGA
jgi:hypothetical protein